MFEVCECVLHILSCIGSAGYSFYFILCFYLVKLLVRILEILIMLKLCPNKSNWNKFKFSKQVLLQNWLDLGMALTGHEVSSIYRVSSCSALAIVKKNFQYSSHQQCVWSPVAPHPHQHSILSVVLLLVILECVQLNLIVVCICIYLRTNDNEAIIISLFPTCIHQMWKNT